MTIAQRKLEAARNLIKQGNVLAAMGLIAEVGEEFPDELDPTLLATVPLWREVVRHLGQKMYGAGLLTEDSLH